MAIAYRGNRSFYIDDSDGTMWDTPKKTRQFDPETNEEITTHVDVVKETIEVSPGDTVTITETVMDSDGISDIATTISEVKGAEINPLECDVCGFIAKTKAGLSVHKLRHA